jgi:hypothetical protein
MDAVLRVIGIVGAAWLLLSILLAVAWALGGKRIFRRPPQPPQLVINTTLSPEQAAADVIAQFKRANKMRGDL